MLATERGRARPVTALRLALQVFCPIDGCFQGAGERESKEALPRRPRVCVCVMYVRTHRSVHTHLLTKRSPIPALLLSQGTQFSAAARISAESNGDFAALRLLSRSPLCSPLGFCLNCQPHATSAWRGATSFGDSVLEFGDCTRPQWTRASAGSRFWGVRSCSNTRLAACVPGGALLAQQRKAAPRFIAFTCDRPRRGCEVAMLAAQRVLEPRLPRPAPTPESPRVP